MPHAPRCSTLLSALALGAAVLALPTAAEAQIKQPGAHPDYSVELEPHLVLDWGDDHHGYGYHDDGIGLGMRATIPFLDNGPVSSINNNMGIGFGLDWAHNGNACDYYYYGNRRYTGTDCSWDNFHLPIVVQWNFWLTPIVSVFGEAGLEISHFRWSIDDGRFCGDPRFDCSGSDTGIYPVFWGGGRFLFGKGAKVGGVVRLGWPYVSLGVGILL